MTLGHLDRLGHLDAPAYLRRRARSLDLGDRTIRSMRQA